MKRLLQIMADLRDPIYGCPWDLRQTFQTIAPYTIEEAYEVLDAVERGDLNDLRDELGDLLLQVVFHARMAEEQKAFDFADVVTAVVDKLVRRHPHVFDAEGRLIRTRADDSSVSEVDAIWESRKADERRMRSESDRPGAKKPDLLGNVAQALPALLRAAKVSEQAASHGFDWPDAPSVVAKVREEVDEVVDALQVGQVDAICEEIGDLLFSVANLARHAGVDPEAALRAGTAKFEARFTAMAVQLAGEGRELADSDLAAMEEAWQAVKRAERAKS